MKPSLRAWFLIVAACFVLHLSFWIAAALLIGYGIAEYIDQWQANKVREKIADDVLFGWEPSMDDPEREDRGSLTRVRLTGENQLVVARVADLLVKMR